MATSATTMIRERASVRRETGYTAQVDSPEASHPENPLVDDLRRSWGERPPSRRVTSGVQRGLSHGNGCGTQELRISRWSALPGLLLNTTALCPANRQDFNAVTVLMRTARRLSSGVGVNFGTGRPPMVTLAKAAPVNPGAIALGARVVSANNAAFQFAFLRGNGRTARCGVGESGCPGGTKGLHERAGATPIDGAVRAATRRCTSPSRAIA